MIMLGYVWIIGLWLSDLIGSLLLSPLKSKMQFREKMRSYHSALLCSSLLGKEEGRNHKMDNNKETVFYRLFGTFFFHEETK